MNLTHLGTFLWKDNLAKGNEEKTNYKVARWNSHFYTSQTIASKYVDPFNVKIIWKNMSE